MTASEQQFGILISPFCEGDLSWGLYDSCHHFFEAFKDSGDCSAVNAYGLGNFIVALALPLAINNAGYF